MKFNVKKNYYLHIYFILVLIFVIDVFSEQSIAVLNIKSEQLKPGDCIAVTNFMTTELQKVPDYKVLAWDDATKMLEHVAGKQALGCDDDKCISEIGGALGVELIVAGDIGQIGNRYLMNIRLINITKAQTLRRVSKTVTGNIGLIIDILPQMVNELIQNEEDSQLKSYNSEMRSELPRFNSMVLIPSKNKTLKRSDLGGDQDEKVSQTVTITYNYWMDTTEVTQEHYQQIMTDTKYGYSGFKNPSWKNQFGSGPNYPVYFVNWYDAVLFCNARSKMEKRDTVYIYSEISGDPGNKCKLKNVKIDYSKKGYRLPTEVEWEYACRAGTNTDYYWGSNNINEYAWYYSNNLDDLGNHRIKEVAGKLPNNFSLYDMIGNIWEWCNDWYGEYNTVINTDPTGPNDGKCKVVRGGAWLHDSKYLRSANRFYFDPKLANRTNGFRTVLLE